MAPFYRRGTRKNYNTTKPQKHGSYHLLNVLYELVDILVDEFIDTLLKKCYPSSLSLFYPVKTVNQ